MWPKFLRFLRFGCVGLANTAVYYVVYRLLLVLLPYLAAHLIAFAIGVIFSFFANCLFTYHVKPTWRRFVEFPATTLINLGITTFGSMLLVAALHMDTRYVTLITTIAAVPFTYLATTFVLARDRGGKRQDSETQNSGVPSTSEQKAG